MRKRTYISAAALAALAALTPQARAGERITLRNGFEVQCTHHAEVEGRVRLYTGSGEDNYIEIGPDDLAAIELVPDPAPVAPAPAADPPASAVRDGITTPRLAQQDLQEMLTKAGKEHHLDVDLLASLVTAESGGNTRAVSRAGARGLMQLMPATAAGLGVADSFAPEQNVRGGSAYLDALLTHYHDNLAVALAAYNAGPAAVAKYHGIPPYRETRAYVARVIHEFNRRVKAREALARQSLAAIAPPALAVPQKGSR